jgi:hypothetical protein
VITSIFDFAEIIDGIRHNARSAKVANDDMPRQMTEAESEKNKQSGSE